MAKTVGIFIGSLREGSYNRKLANAAMTMFPKDYTLVEVSFGELPFYNEDLESKVTLPPAWKEFRNTLDTLDAVFFFTPEYNRSVPAALKNAIDVGSRPFAENRWAGLPAGVISSSPGGVGGFGANHHLRQALVCVNAPTMPQPESYIGNVHTLLGENGAVENPRTISSLQRFVDRFVLWIHQNQGWET